MSESAASAAETTLWMKEKTEVKDGKKIHTLEKETVGPDGVSMLHTEKQKTYIDKDGHEHTEVKSKTKPIYD
ncbi:hypothetical protein RvY_12014 [Ramazzottius varieornatus]|uniref:Uncharacterized protein n=1 Tax=Ramazzottius varieornatus TaxID=947166 RepID=A0A1D1VHY9_RAMVA|nr:hypothetical protein RvY_12014 [Ramazzottius varieornatus]